jgi:hypothetical protein
MRESIARRESGADADAPAVRHGDRFMLGSWRSLFGLTKAERDCRV